MTAPVARGPAVPLVVGHRGACGHAPENTLVSIRRAAALGATWVEFDVKLTADGVPILMHDVTLDRTTDGTGPVAHWPLERIRGLDAGSWFDPAFAAEPVPTLDEVLVVLSALGLGANVEIKPCPGRAAETARAVTRCLAEGWHPALPPIVISSFDETALATVRETDPRFSRALLVNRVPSDWRGRLERLGCDALHCEQKGLRGTTIRAVTAAGYPVRCFTVNDRARARKLVGHGVRCLITDYPERMAGVGLSAPP